MRTLFDVPSNLVRTRQEPTVPALFTDAHPTYEKIRALEAAIPLVFDDLLDIEDITDHEFCDGVYRREFFLAKDAVVVSKIHKKENWFLLFTGEVSIASADGTVTRVKAPYLAKTPINTKRVVYAHEDSIMYTFHGNPDNETDLVKLEDRYIMPEEKATLPRHIEQALLENKR